MVMNDGDTRKNDYCEVEVKKARVRLSQYRFGAESYHASWEHLKEVSVFKGI